MDHGSNYTCDSMARYGRALRFTNMAPALNHSIAKGFGKRVSKRLPYTKVGHIPCPPVLLSPVSLSKGWSIPLQALLSTMCRPLDMAECFDPIVMQMEQCGFQAARLTVDIPKPVR